MTKFLMVDVESVNSSIPRTDFSEADLDILADMILESGGILKPLVIKKTGFDKYEVVDGHFEYYAAVRASEKNPVAGEMVNALIISNDKEEAVLQQATILRGVNYSDRPVRTIAETTSSESSRLAKLELLIENQLNEFKLELAQERQRVEDKLKQIESQIPKQITPLEAFNTLNLLELTYRLRTAGFTDKKAVNIAESIEKERNKKQFVSLSDVVMRVKVYSGKKQIKGITSDKMVDIIDGWSRVLFV